MISRNRGSTSPCPRIPAPSGRIRAASSPCTWSVRNSASGSSPLFGGIHFRSASSTAGS